MSGDKRISIELHILIGLQGIFLSESLCDYMACFNDAMLEVRNLDELVVMSMLKQRLQNEHLIFFLDKMFLRDYAILLT